jgi:hypothetical protein
MTVDSNQQEKSLNQDQDSESIEPQRDAKDVQNNTNLSTVNTDKDNAVQKLTNQINFSTKALEVKQQALSEILENSAGQLNKLVSTFKTAIADQQKQYDILQKEVGVLTLLPEKTKEKIEEIIPILVRQVDSIYQEKVQAIDNICKSAMSANQEFKDSIDQKLEQYSHKLSDSATYVMKYGNNGFLKNMFFVVLFSTIISGITAYAVTTQFPRYFKVTGASSVTIHDSNVHVLSSEVKNKTVYEDKKLSK